MSKAVLISIQPKWCNLIANGKKTIEVRKSRPKLEVPFKVYIYCTIGNPKNPHELLEIHSPNGKICKANGKVIGEFVCDKIECVGIPYPAYSSELDRQYTEKSCINYGTLHEYCGHGNLYFWHISNLQIYDKPRELSEFGRYDKPIVCPQNRCDKCGHWRYMRVNADEYDYDCDCNGLLDNFISLRRPPQSWCYVEECEKNA